jgi:EAL domain-containing protein (putative c-di-GMP-specific phosphodiesterase class I)
MKDTNEISAKLIEEAINNNELLLHYQLQSSVSSNKIVSMEALTRWQSPALGNVDTAKFIGALEICGTSLVAKFHKWLLRKALTQIVAWQEIGVSVPVFLNFSTRYLQEEECLTVIPTLLQEYNLPPSCIGIEVTESSAITNMAGIKFVLQGLHEIGIKIALDDFCTSYCSLEYLSELPASIIKIDQRFIHGLAHQDSRYQKSVSIMLDAIVDMSIKLGVEVVAEGVETLQQLEQVTYLGCDTYQGYLYCPPIPADYVAAMILNTQSQRSNLSSQLQAITMI